MNNYNIFFIYLLTEASENIQMNIIWILVSIVINFYNEKNIKGRLKVNVIYSNLTSQLYIKFVISFYFIMQSHECSV